MASEYKVTKHKAGRLADQDVWRGQRGETHQIAGGEVPVLTTQQGVPVGDDQNSLRIGPRWRISISGRRSSISIMSAFRNASSTRGALAPMAFLNLMNRSAT